jgi:hypothetical protein
MKKAFNRGKRIVLLCLPLCILLAGCGYYLDYLLPPPPDEFYWKSTYWTRCTGVILSPLDSVKQTHSNGYIMEKGGSVAYMSERLTNFRTIFTVKVLEGQGVRLRTRTTIERMKDEPGISLDYTTKGIEIRDGNTLIASTDTIRAIAGNEELIRFDIDGTIMRIAIGCNMPFIFTTKQAATEYMFTETLPASRVAITGIEVIPIRLARISN